MRNYIDTRDLYKEQQELIEEIDFLKECLENSEGEQESVVDEMQYDLEEKQERLKVLNDLETEIGSEWQYGETLIPVECFPEYAEDLASDLYGDEIRDAKWPFYHIDWDKAADDLAQDYSMITFEGVDYYFRMS